MMLYHERANILKYIVITRTFSLHNKKIHNKYRVSCIPPLNYYKIYLIVITYKYTNMPTRIMCKMFTLQNRSTSKLAGKVFVCVCQMNLQV